MSRPMTIRLNSISPDDRPHDCRDVEQDQVSRNRDPHLLSEYLTDRAEVAPCAVVREEKLEASNRVEEFTGESNREVDEPDGDEDEGAREQKTVEEGS